jgi:hypothetical protein
MNHNGSPLKRRNFLHLGLGALGGIGLSDILKLRSQAAAAKGTGANDVRCILVWLDGGPSHYETFDPKPDAPKEIRGEFKSIKTKTPGIHFSEVIPKLAEVSDKLTIVRSIAHEQNNHGAGNHYMMTGRPTPVPVGCGAFVTFHPSYGSVVSYKRGMKQGMPPYISTPRMTRSGGPNFLGAQHAPFIIADNPDSKGFKVRDVSIPSAVNDGRANSRKALRESLDQLKRINETIAEDPAVSFDEFYSQGFELITSQEAQAAFDIEKEPEQMRELYGRNDFGQRLLLARRLTEVGVPFITVSNGGWDDHSDLFKGYKKDKAGRLDQGLSALISDLHQRGTLDNTLVIALGEFGRTPKVNERGGRDHWSFAMSVLMAGAGIPGGQVVGATDAKGYYASENIYSPEDFAASIYTKMGIDPSLILHDTANRPLQLVDHGHPIKELFV